MKPFMGSYQEDGREGRKEVYSEADLAKVAKVIWRGRRSGGFEKHCGMKWCEPAAVGMTMQKAYFVTTIQEWWHLRTHEWIDVGGGFQVKIDSNCRPGYSGRLWVRRVS